MSRGCLSSSSTTRGRFRPCSLVTPAPPAPQKVLRGHTHHPPWTQGPQPRGNVCRVHPGVPAGMIWGGGAHFLGASAPPCPQAPSSGEAAEWGMWQGGVGLLVLQPSASSSPGSRQAHAGFCSASSRPRASNANPASSQQVRSAPHGPCPTGCRSWRGAGGSHAPGRPHSFREGD